MPDRAQAQGAAQVSRDDEGCGWTPEALYRRTFPLGSTLDLRSAQEGPQGARGARGTEDPSEDGGRPHDRPAPSPRVVCAWCADVMVEGDPGATTSHGLCESCEREHFPDEETDR